MLMLKNIVVGINKKRVNRRQVIFINSISESGLCLLTTLIALQRFDN